MAFFRTGKKDEVLRDRIVDILMTTGYPDYAIALGGFKQVLPMTENLKPYPGMKRMPPGATDYQNLYVKEGMSDDETSVLVRHEILHVILRHKKRIQKHHKPRLWNIACDFELSNYYSAKDDKVIKDSEHLSPGCNVMECPEYAEMTAEEIYDKMIEQGAGQEEEQIIKMMLQMVSGQGGQGGKGDQEESEEGEGQGQGQEKEDGEGEEEEGEFGFDLDLSEDEQDKLREAIQAAINDGYDKLTDEQKQQMEDSPMQPGGKSGLGGTQHVHKKVRPPNPEELQLYYDLRRFFLRQQNVGKGQTYRKPNKKYQGTKIIKKGRANVYQPQKTLAVYVDVSGSMSPQKLARAIGVLRTIEGMKRVTFIVKYFSTHLQDEYYEGGGTDYEIIFADAQKEDYTCVAIITDNSHSYFRNKYQLEAVWIAGIEEGGRGNYSISSLINQPDSPIQCTHFKCSVVGHD